MTSKNMFYLIKIYDNDSENYELFLDILSGIFLKRNIISYKDNYVLIKNVFKKDSILDFLDTIVDDFEIRLSCFVGVKNTEEYIDFIYQQMEKLAYSTNNSLLDEGELLSKIMKQVIDEEVKKVVLGKFYNDSEMINTIKVFLETNMNTLKASQLLYLHRNTLMNRINKFIEVTGYNIKEFKEAIIVYNLLK